MNSVTRIAILSSILLLSCRYVRCSFDIPGETSPSSVEIEKGDNVNITCRMNLRKFPNNNASNLHFMDATNHENVSASDIIILNRTTILYMLRNAQESKTIYRCMCGKNAIMDTKVYVGHKPDPISDFTCRSYNYEKMKCNFTKPHNFILTQYNVSYHFNLNAYKYSPGCDYSMPPIVTCTALEPYHPNDDIFHYKIIASNSLGTYVSRFDVDSMSVTVLAPPGQNFSLKHVTTDSATFTFRLKNSLLNFLWDVKLKPKNLNETVLSPQIRPVYISGNEFELRLTNLTYANYEYQVYLRVRLSTNNSWSEPFKYWFRTLSRLPDRPPRIDVGAFETDPSETKIRLYWELLEPYEHNGYNFTYVVGENKAAQFVNLSSMGSNTAEFPWKKELQYEFSIHSRNHVGLSQSAARITIPAMTSENKIKLHTPPAVYNVYHESNSTFTLTWTEPTIVENLVDYTVYWCRKKIPLLNSCEGSIHFQHVPRNTRQYTTDPQEHTLSLAVSANYENFNTGMHWAECTTAETTDLVRMEPHVEAISPTSIKVEWGSENMCPSIFDGYNLSYCAVDLINCDESNTAHAHAYNCIIPESEQYIQINKTFKRWELLDLKPYTCYKVEIFMYSQRTHKFGKKSKPEFSRTKESAPSPPLQLNVSRISNESATLSWLPPKEPNGVIRIYLINKNNEFIEVKMNNNAIASNGRVVHELQNLSSSTSYNVYVLAQTVAEAVSNSSNKIDFVTLVGYPSKPVFMNSKRIRDYEEVSWDAPEGKVDFYEVAITVLKGEEIISRRISIVNGSNSCTFPTPKCISYEHKTTATVRSVNVAGLRIDNTNVVKDEDASFYQDAEELICSVKSSVEESSENVIDPSAYRLYKSDWVGGSTVKCAASERVKILLYILSTTFVIASLSLLLFFMRKKYYKMANINCRLPAGLDAYVTKDSASAALSHNFLTTLTTIKGNIMNNDSGVVVEDRNNTVIPLNAHDFMVQNEEQRLVEATSQNSLLISDQTEHIGIRQKFASTLLGDTTFDRVNHLEFSSGNQISENDCLTQSPTTNSSNLTDTPSITTNTYSPHVLDTNIFNQPISHNDVKSMLPVNSSYIKPNELNNWKCMKENQSQIVNPSSGYVSAESVAKLMPKTKHHESECEYTSSENIPKLNRNINNARTIIEPPEQPLPSQEYIRASNFMVNNPTGYTTLDQLSRMPALTPAFNNWATHNATLQPAISGYVTQRDLNAFGQQQQQDLS